MEDRGFKKLKGKTIKEVRVDAVNEVKILCTDGTFFTIDADEQFHGIGMPRLTKEKGKLEKLPRPPRKPAEVAQTPVPPLDIPAWPFPKYADQKESM